MISGMISETDGDWVWVMGDDHVFRPDILVRLIAHNRDIVVPHCKARQPPYNSVLYDRRLDGHYYIKDLTGLSGLIPVAAAGSAGMLIRRHVLERMPDPWFELGKTTRTDLHGEALTFCRKATAAGFDIWADLDTPLGHVTTIEVWPKQMPDGRWGTVLGLSPDQPLAIPPWADIS